MFRISKDKKLRFLKKSFTKKASLIFWFARRNSENLYSVKFHKYIHSQYIKSLKTPLIDIFYSSKYIDSLEAINFISENDLKFFFYKRIKSIYFFLKSYSFLFNRLSIEKYFKFKIAARSNRALLFKLFFHFSRNRVFVILRNKFNNNLFFISLGFFLKYFEKKKALKKTKYFKILLSKALRKIFILAKLFKLFVFVKGIPVFFSEMLKTLNSRIEHPFYNPSHEKPYDESTAKSKIAIIKIIYLFFLQNKSFVPIKTRKRGRIKRKIRRKIVAKNKIID